MCKQLYYMLLLSGLASYAAAADKNVVAANSVSSVSLSTCGVDAKSPVTVSMLDKAWSCRENEDNQKIIAEYLLTEPKVPENNYEAAWKMARLVYFIGNYGVGEKRFVSTTEGVKLFDYGAQAGKIAKKLNPGGVEGYYWYAIDLGSYGLAKGIMASARKAGDGMEALNKAILIDPSYQWYGSSRILGRYYQELPVFLYGGDKAKALQLLTEATTKAPKFSNNWVFLGQYYLKMKQPDNALAACKKALMLPEQDGKYEEVRYRREAQECVDQAKDMAPKG